MTGSLRTLTTDLIDYAGLFPPAKLEMDRSVESAAIALVLVRMLVIACPFERTTEGDIPG